jgi:predicted RNA-binding Zn-ribbon protein involved in translation (DUF1610 family)
MGTVELRKKVNMKKRSINKELKCPHCLKSKKNRCSRCKRKFTKYEEQETNVSVAIKLIETL